MFYRDEVVNDYFYWLVEMISNGKEQSYTKLLMVLFETDFIPELDRDINRSEDGLELRDRYAYEMGMNIDISKPCSILEMMIALAIRCETDVMYNPETGDRTYIWFWLMIENLGLLGMTDRIFDVSRVRRALRDLMTRNYEPNGRGGLFYVPGVNDMREKEIWYQMNTFLNGITG